jgi:predicted cupin superfamily sugar epimerase
MTPDEVVRLLGLAPHPEGGFYRETFRDSSPATAPSGERGASTAIYYLLRQEDESAWHRVDAAEVWHHYAGAPLDVTLSVDGRERSTLRLGTDLAAGERPQVVVPAGVRARRFRDGSPRLGAGLEAEIARSLIASLRSSPPRPASPAG